jgi:hypothetical protein
MEIVSLFLWFLGILATASVGFLVLWSFHALPRSHLEMLATSFLIGGGIVSFELFITSVFGIPWNLLWLMTPWIVMALAHHAHHPSEPFFPSIRLPSAKTLWKTLPHVDLLLFIALLALVGALFDVTTEWPLQTVDSFAIWALKGRAFFHDHGLFGTFFRYDHTIYSHWDYPLHVPLFLDWLAQWMGAFHIPLLKTTNGLLVASGVVLFWSGLRDFIGRRASFLWSLMLVSIPTLFKTAGISLEADLSLALFFLGSGIALFRAFQSHEPREWILLGLFTGLAGWTKNEGMSWLLVVGVMLLLSAVRRKIEMRHAMGAMGVAIALSLPWRLFQWSHGFESDLFSAPLVFHADRWQIIVKAVAQQFSLWESWGILWIIAIIAGGITLIRWIRRTSQTRPTMLSLGGTLLLQGAMYMLIYFITPLQVEWHLGSSLDRIMLHLAPLTLFISALILSPKSEGSPLPLESADWQRWQRLFPWLAGSAGVSLALLASPLHPTTLLIAVTLLIPLLLGILPRSPHPWKTLPNIWWVATGLTLAITILHPFYPENVLFGGVMLLGLFLFAGLALSSGALSSAHLFVILPILGSGLSLAAILRALQGSSHLPDLSILFLALPVAIADLQTSTSLRRSGQLISILLMATAIVLPFLDLPAWDEEWNIALVIFRDHPWMGVGAGQLPLFFPSLADRWMDFSLAPHSMVLQWLAELGIVGLTIIASLTAVVLWRTRHIRPLLTRSLIIFLSASAIVTNWSSPLPWIALCMILGMLWAEKTFVKPASAPSVSSWPLLWASVLVATWIGFFRLAASDVLLQTAEQLQQGFGGSLRAEPLLDQAERLAPLQSTLLRARAQNEINMVLDHIPEKDHHYQQAAEAATLRTLLLPHDADGWFQLADIKRIAIAQSDPQFQTVIAMSQRTIRRDPWNHPAYYLQLGMLHERRDHVQEAQNVYHIGLERFTSRFNLSPEDLQTLRTIQTRLQRLSAS